MKNQFQNEYNNLDQAHFARLTFNFTFFKSSKFFFGCQLFLDLNRVFGGMAYIKSHWK